MVEIFPHMFTRNFYLFVGLPLSFSHSCIGVCQLKNYIYAHVVCGIELIKPDICKVCPVFYCSLHRRRNILTSVVSVIPQVRSCF